MCMIAYQPAGSPALLDEWLRNGWEHNPHGAGYMFADEKSGNLVIRKPFYKLKELLAAYATDHQQFGATSPFIVHFRWATHGSHKEHNVHPHALAAGTAGLVHNGILSQFDPIGKADISDTVLFCRTVLAFRTAEELTSDPLNKILAEMIGRCNKLAIMDCLGNVSIVNAQEGVWHDSTYWFSNSDFRFPPTRSKGFFQAASGIARGIVFGNDSQAALTLPAAYQPKASETASGPAPVQTELVKVPGVQAGSLWDNDKADCWEDTDLAADDDAPTTVEVDDEYWGLLEEAFELTERMYDLDSDEWRELGSICLALASNLEDAASRQERLDTEADEWEDEQRMVRAMARDGR